MCLTKQSISDFYRDPQLRVTLDVEKLARLFDPWPQMEYRISHCSNVCFSHYMEEEEWYIYFSHMDCYLQILLPYSFLGHFILFSLDMKSRTVSILDPMPIPHTFKGFEPTLYYVHKIKNIANNLKLAMQVAYPAWNDDIYVWRRILPKSVPKLDDR